MVSSQLMHDVEVEVEVDGTTGGIFYYLVASATLPQEVFMIGGKWNDGLAFLRSCGFSG